MPLLALGAVVILLGRAQAVEPVTDDIWQPAIAEAAGRFRLPPAWIRAVIAVESGGRNTQHDRPIVSKADAIGLMQLMPQTFTEMRHQHDLGRDPHEPRTNILAGTAYLRHLYDRFGNDGAFAAYNAGPARYQAHLSRHMPLPAETVAYLAAIATALESTAGPVLAAHKTTAIPPADLDASRKLFIIRSGDPVASKSQRLFAPLSGSGR